MMMKISGTSDRMNKWLQARTDSKDLERHSFLPVVSLNGEEEILLVLGITRRGGQSGSHAFSLWASNATSNLKCEGRVSTRVWASAGLGLASWYIYGDEGYGLKREGTGRSSRGTQILTLYSSTVIFRELHLHHKLNKCQLNLINILLG